MEDSKQLPEELLLGPLEALLGKKITKYPGMMPTNVDKANVTLIPYGYCCAPKADGDCVLGFISQKKLVLLRRNMQTQTFILSHCFEQDFIFEGEYIAARNCYLIYDTWVFQNEPALRLDYLTRIELAQHFINVLCPQDELHLYKNSIIQTTEIKPLPSKQQWGITWKSNNIKLQVKPPYHTQDCAALWHARNILPYNCDGIIFTRLWCAYRMGSSDLEAVLKWKEDVTTDFLVEIVMSKKKALFLDGLLPEEYANPNDDETKQNAILYSFYQSECVPISKCVLSDEQIRISSHQICEFSWNKQQGIWVWMRLRPDKTLPNTVNTVIAGITSIRDNITIDDIANNH